MSKARGNLSLVAGQRREPGNETATVDERRFIYRKVSEKINRDPRYLAMSPVLPSGRSLFVHFLIGPHVTPLPGLSNVGRAAIAEVLGWDLEDFDRAFKEVAEQGLAKADWKARVLWLPSAIKNNEPQSPNVVKSWRGYWTRIPDCELKAEACEVLFDHLGEVGSVRDQHGATTFLAEFVKACEKPSAKPFGMSSGKGSAEPSGDSIGIQGAGNREQSYPSQENRISQDSALRPGTDGNSNCHGANGDGRLEDLTFDRERAEEGRGAAR